MMNAYERELIAELLAAFESVMAHYGHSMPPADQASRSALLIEAQTQFNWEVRA